MEHASVLIAITSLHKVRVIWLSHFNSYRLILRIVDEQCVGRKPFNTAFMSLNLICFLPPLFHLLSIINAIRKMQPIIGMKSRGKRVRCP